MDWNDLKYFLAVARAKSLSLAARQLGVSVSTVSRRIVALEQALALTLFSHHRDGYELTQAGIDLLPTAEDAAAQMSRLERAALETQGEYVGGVRLDVPELLGQHILLPVLQPLMQSYPDIRLDIRLGVQPVRLAAQESDIVLRLVRPERGSYKIRSAGKIGFGLYCSQDYARRCGVPEHIDDLRRHRLIGWHDDMQFLTMALWLNELCPDGKNRLSLNSLNAQLSAVECGLGIAVLPRFAAERANLQRLLPEGPNLTLDLWSLVQEQSAKLPRVRVVAAHLRQVFKNNEQMLKNGFVS